VGKPFGSICGGRADCSCQHIGDPDPWHKTLLFRQCSRLGPLATGERAILHQKAEEAAE